LSAVSFYCFSFFCARAFHVCFAVFHSRSLILCCLCIIDFVAVDDCQLRSLVPPNNRIVTLYYFAVLFGLLPFLLSATVGQTKKKRSLLEITVSHFWALQSVFVYNIIIYTEILFFRLRELMPSENSIAGHLF